MRLPTNFVEAGWTGGLHVLVERYGLSRCPICQTYLLKAPELRLVLHHVDLLIACSLIGALFEGVCFCLARLELFPMAVSVGFGRGAL